MIEVLLLGDDPGGEGERGGGGPMLTGLQEYLAHNNPHPRRTLPWGSA